MFDWILEADIARLNRALLEAGDDRERMSLQELRARKMAQLDALRTKHDLASPLP
jgi:hypothetical protein